MAPKYRAPERRQVFSKRVTTLVCEVFNVFVISRVDFSTSLLDFLNAIYLSHQDRQKEILQTNSDTVVLSWQSLHIWRITFYVLAQRSLLYGSNKVKCSENVLLWNFHLQNDTVNKRLDRFTHCLFLNDA